MGGRIRGTVTRMWTFSLSSTRGEKISLRQHFIQRKRSPVSGPAMKRAWKSFLHPNNKKKLNKLKNQQLFLNPSENWGHKPLAPRLERQTGRYNESQLTWAEIRKQKPPQEPAPGWGKLNCNWRIAGGSEYTNLRIKNSRGAQTQLVSPLGALPDSHSGALGKKTFSCFQQKEKRNHLEIRQNVLIFLTRSALRRNYFTRA